LRKNLLVAKDSVFFDWLKKDVVDVKEAKLNRFKEHTETMAKRVEFDSAKRTAQFAAIQDDIAMLFDSSSSKSSSDPDETDVNKRHRARRAQRKQDNKRAKRKKAKELARQIEADRVCHKEEEEAFKAETTNGTEDNGLSKVGTLVCISFQNRIWFNLGMLLWVNHRDCFEEQLHYLQKDLTKPHKISVLESVKRVEVLFKYMPFLPPPSSKNMMYDQADWKKRNLSIDKATIRRCQFHALPELFQQRLLDNPDDWKAMTEVVWLDHLLRAEEYDKQIIASKERIAKKADKATSSTSRADDTSNTKRHKKNLKPKSATEKTAQGKARYCCMCKKTGMPEGK